MTHHPLRRVHVTTAATPPMTSTGMSGSQSSRASCAVMAGSRQVRCRCRRSDGTCRFPARQRGGDLAIRSLIWSGSIIWMTISSPSSCELPPPDARAQPRLSSLVGSTAALTWISRDTELIRGFTAALGSWLCENGKRETALRSSFLVSAISRRKCSGPCTRRDCGEIHSRDFSAGCVFTQPGS